MKKTIFFIALSVVFSFCLIKDTKADTGTFQVGASTDDAYRSTVTTSYWVTNDVRVLIGYYNATYQNFGSPMRFLNINIPAGSTITQANLKITSYTNDSSAVVNSRIRAERNINPATFSTAADFDARTWTTAAVNWDNIPAWTLNTEYTSPNFSTAIQEVINLPGWTSGNPIVILWDDFQERSTQSDNIRRDGYSYKSSAANAPKLVVTYTLPVTTPTVTTQAATNIQTNSATGNGNITNTGGASCDQRGVEWGTTLGGPYPNSAVDSGSFGTGAFTKDMTGLSSGTPYYYRAKAHNSAGWGYGSEYNFTTATPPPPCINHNVSGWAWSNMAENPGGLEGIGWISFSCKNQNNPSDYGVDITLVMALFPAMRGRRTSAGLILRQPELIPQRQIIQ